MARFLILLGAAILVIGLLWPYLSRLGIVRLPGVLVIVGRRTSFLSTFASCLLLRLLLSVKSATGRRCTHEFRHGGGVTERVRRLHVDKIGDDPQGGLQCGSAQHQARPRLGLKHRFPD